MEVSFVSGQDLLQQSVGTEEKMNLANQEQSVVKTTEAGEQSQSSAGDSISEEELREAELIMDMQFQELREEETRDNSNNDWLLQNMSFKA